ncbi:MAG: BREX-6 system BrxE protein [Elainella sp.]
MEQMIASTLDAILALQMSVAWAGEGLCEPKRLDWWRTDLIDMAGGGYFLHELLPKTYEWASLEAVRKVAVAWDKQLRQRMAQPDQVRTLFFWGFAVDEQLDDRLLEHKRSGKSPSQMLPLPLNFGNPFAKADFEEAIRVPNQMVDFQVVPGGREIKGQLPNSPELSARNLTAALLPLTDQYPLPFYRLRGA